MLVNKATSRQQAKLRLSREMYICEKRGKMWLRLGFGLGAIWTVIILFLMGRFIENWVDFFLVFVPLVFFSAIGYANWKNLKEDYLDLEKKYNKYK